MALYRQVKVPTVEAVEWTGNNLAEVVTMIRQGIDHHPQGHVPPNLEQNIQTALSNISIGDFIVRQHDTFVPVAGMIFRQKYAKITVVEDPEVASR